MRIGLYSMTYPPTPDGVASYVHSLKTSLERQHDVFVITTGQQPNGRVREKSNVYMIPSFPFPPYPVYRVALLPILRGMRITERRRPDVLHAHTPFFFGTMAYLSKRKFGLPLVSTFHTDLPSMKGTLKTPAMDRVIDVGWGYACALYNKCDMIIAPTQVMADKLRHSGVRAPIRVVSNGIDIKRFEAAPGLDIRKRYNIGDEKIVLFLGRLTRDKGVYTLLDSAEGVHKRTGAVFLVAGVGPEAENLRAAAEKRGLKNVFRMLGYVTDEEKRPLLHSADVFVLPSRAEIFSIVLLEAMACGTPVIAAAAGGNLDVVSQDKNGVLFPWDDSRMLADDICSVLEEGRRRRLLIEGGSRFVREKASIEASSKRTLEVYEELLRR